MNDRWSRILCVVALAGAFDALSAARASAHGDGPGIDIRELAMKADFVFKGRVIDIRYRESEPVVVRDDTGAPVLDRAGRPVLQDGSDLPYTFVTYEVEEIYKGNAEGRSVTLRFYGGLADEPWTGVDESGNTVVAPMEMRASTIPLFDVGDRDLLFVEGNTSHECPLVDGPEGRLRLLPATATRGVSSTTTATKLSASVRARTPKSRWAGFVSIARS